jgi:D-alanyl-D-alanine dipeptidase
MVIMPKSAVHHQTKEQAPRRDSLSGCPSRAKLDGFFALGVIHSAQRLSTMRPTIFLQSINVRRCGLILVLLPLGLAQEASFRITPKHPVEELRAEALKAQPPREPGTFLKPNLLELVELDPTIKLDIRYATSNNFLGTSVYTQARAFLQRPAAEALLRAHRELKAQGYGLIIHDGYRPWYVTKIFWDATPDDKKIFVADPAEGSRHNRGCAVDLSLYDLKTGKEVKMPSGYDEMTDRAFADYAGGTADERARRALLRQAMEKQGFTVYPQEWWHFDYKDWKQYPILNVKFEDLGQ